MIVLHPSKPATIGRCAATLAQRSRRRCDPCHLSQFWFREKWVRCLKLSIVMSVTTALGGHTLFCARVAQTKERPMSYEQKSSRRDHLTSTSKDGKIELTEEQLGRVGGAGVHLKYQAALKVRTETVYP